MINRLPRHPDLAIEAVGFTGIRVPVVMREVTRRDVDLDPVALLEHQAGRLHLNESAVTSFPVPSMRVIRKIPIPGPG